MQFAIVYGPTQLQVNELENRFGLVDRCGEHRANARFYVRDTGQLNTLMALAKEHGYKWRLGNCCAKCGADKVTDLFKGEYCPRCNDWC